MAVRRLGRPLLTRGSGFGHVDGAAVVGFVVLVGAGLDRLTLGDVAEVPAVRSAGAALTVRVVAPGVGLIQAGVAAVVVVAEALVRPCFGRDVMAVRRLSRPLLTLGSVLGHGDRAAVVAIVGI